MKAEKVFEILLNLIDGGADECDIVTLDEARAEYPYLFPEIENLEIGQSFSCPDEDEEVGIYTITRIVDPLYPQQ